MKKKILKLSIILLFTFCFALIVKAFLVEAFRIPTNSMANTILSGDFVLVNKFVYGIKTPSTLPLTNIKLPVLRLFPFNQPERNDVLVFEFPGEQFESVSNHSVTLVKRVIGLPGDTVAIIDNEVFVNGIPQQDPKHAIVDKRVSRDYGNADDKIFPKGKNWNKYFYGPIVIPKAEMKIEINSKNIGEVETAINREFGRKAVSVEGSVITISGKPVREYTFTKNHYFVLGDNRDNSSDSRYWGFVPEDLIIGRADLIYWSVDSTFKFTNPDKLFHSIRFNRIFSRIE